MRQDSDKTNYTEGYLDKLQALAHIGIWEWDLESDTLKWSDEMYRILGLDRKTCTPQASEFNSFIHEDDQGISSEEAFIENASKGNYSMEFRVVRQDNGDVRHVIVHGEVTKTDSGKPLMITGTMQDITEQKKAESLLQVERQRYHDFLDNLDAGVVAHAPDTSVLFCNSRALELLGLSLEQITGKTAMDPYWKFLNEDGTDMKLEDYPVNLILRTMSKLEHYVVGVSHPNSNNTTWAICNGLPVFSDNGELDHVLISFLDITERISAQERETELQEKLVRAERMESLGVLAGGVAHDLNNVLGPMVALPDIIADDIDAITEDNTEPKEAALESLDLIRTSARRASKVVNDLVGMSRRGSTVQKPINVSELTCLGKSCIHIKKIREDRPEITITQNIKDKKMISIGDKEHLERVLQNLLLNAEQAIEGEGSIEVTAYAKTFEEDYSGYDTVPTGSANLTSRLR